MARQSVVVGLLSLEPWDDVWRRNQHLAAALLDGEHADEVVFVEPPRPGREGAERRPFPGVTVVTPPLPLPRRLGGLALTAGWLRARHLGRTTHLWVNDAPLGVLCLRGGQPVLYDVTDDWRDAEQSDRARARLVAAEDRLARTALTVVCSDVLRARWRERYGVDATLVPNAVDVRVWRCVQPRALPGPGPHAGYVGTLHDERLDVDLVERAARELPGTLHLVGPDHLQAASRERLRGAGVVLHGPVPADEVPAWTTALDVVLCPHVVTPFTLSLDAIKAYEYAASGRPVVATPTSGFQQLVGVAGVHIAQGEDFVAALGSLLSDERAPTEAREVPTWGDRAASFAAALNAAPEAPERWPTAPTVPVRLRRRAARELRWAAANARSPRVRVGRGSDIGPGLHLSLEGAGRIWVGERCVLDRGATLHSAGELVIGDGTVVGHRATLAAKESVRIGRDCLLAEMVSVRDHDHRFDDLETPITAQGSTTGPVVLEDGVWLGARVVVTRGVRVGAGTIVGAGSVVTKDLPAGVVAAGVPAKVIRQRTSSAAT